MFFDLVPHVPILLYFTVNIAEFLRASILKNIWEQLLLKFDEIIFWSWNIIVLNLLWKTYFNVHFIKQLHKHSYH